ncbi:DUF2125 domain-containing protein [Paracoccus aestuariivivens]|uniref:DUF2125 domain-containing protein n=1 Tax=Paracoccus aestuariivivens TaxID=1820333 RepID=UPI00147837BB|nr:DUF2125 domain-containing protein [Paracoccus aestuariivivens]
MRGFIILLAILAVFFGGIWFGIQSFMAREIGRLAEAGTGFTVGSITKLSDPSRIGVHLTEPRIVTPNGSLSLPEAYFSVGPLSPTTATLTLPATATLDLGTGPHELGMADPKASVHFMAFSGLAPGRAVIRTGPLTLDGQPLAASLEVDTKLGELAQDMPQGSQAVYDLTFDLAGLNPAALPQIAGLAERFSISDPVAFQGSGKIWLDALPTSKALQTPPTPLPTGLQIDSADLKIGTVGARLIGRLEADETGRAKGALALYTSDAQALLQTAADAGMIPQSVVMIGRTMIRTVSSLSMEPAPNISFPEPQAGELRLPITFAEGRMRLGPIPIGQAPLLRP